jgi:predicted nucleic acid-binding protein
VAFTVIYDACVLFPAPLRDLLIRLGQTSIVRARSSERILDEVFRNILLQRPELDEPRLTRTRQLMNAAIADVLVEDFEALEPSLSLPDEDDRHVLAAAIRVGAQAIVTFNLKDFPASALAAYGVEAVDPDSFIVDLIDLAPGTVLRVVEDQARALKHPPQSFEELLETLSRHNLHRTVARLRELSPELLLPPLQQTRARFTSTGCSKRPSAAVGFGAGR